MRSALLAGTVLRKRRGELLRKTFEALDVQRSASDRKAHNTETLLDKWERGQVLVLRRYEKKTDPAQRDQKIVRRIVKKGLNLAAAAGWITATARSVRLTPAGSRAYQKLPDTSDFWTTLKRQPRARPPDRNRFAEVFITVLGRIGLGGLILASFTLLALGGFLFYELLQLILQSQGGLGTQGLVGAIINEILLIFIVLEIVETAYYQIEMGLKRGPGRALGRPLAKSLLVIGLLASIRHLLAVGIELSRHPFPTNEVVRGQPTLNDVLGALGVSGGLVIGLALVLVIVVRFYRPKDDREDDETDSAVTA